MTKFYFAKHILGQESGNVQFNFDMVGSSLEILLKSQASDSKKLAGIFLSAFIVINNYLTEFNC